MTQQPPQTTGTPNTGDNASSWDLRFDVADLVGRPGSHRRVETAVQAGAPDQHGPAMQLAAGDQADVTIDLESVVEGIYVHGTVDADLVGECSRCLDPVEQAIRARFDELFLYPNKVRRGEEQDAVLLEDDQVDLTPLVRDTLAIEADERPLCREDCPGLCPQCGARMEDDPDHEHVVIDDRWAALQGLFSDSGTTDGPETEATADATAEPEAER